MRDMPGPGSAPLVPLARRRSWRATSIMGSSVRCSWVRAVSSDRHIHDFLVRIDQAVTHFGEVRETRRRSFLHLEHDLRQLDTRRASFEGRGERFVAFCCVWFTESMTLLEQVAELRLRPTCLAGSVAPGPPRPRRFAGAAQTLAFLSAERNGSWRGRGRFPSGSWRVCSVKPPALRRRLRADARACGAGVRGLMPRRSATSRRGLPVRRASRIRSFRSGRATSRGDCPSIANAAAG